MRLVSQFASVGSMSRAMTRTSSLLDQATFRLSSGKRLQRAADDASGLVLSELARSTANGSRVGLRNLQDATSLAQVAEGALGETNALLQHARELSIASGNDALGQGARDALASEMEQTFAEIDRISAATGFGGKSLINADETLTFQAGAGENDQVQLEMRAADTASLGLNTSTLATAVRNGDVGALDSMDSALSEVQGMRSDLGAFANGAAHSMQNLSVSLEATERSLSQIEGADMAREAMRFSQHQIMTRGQAALAAQANSAASHVLRLFG